MGAKLASESNTPVEKEITKVNDYLQLALEDPTKTINHTEEVQDEYQETRRPSTRKNSANRIKTKQSKETNFVLKNKEGVSSTSADIMTSTNEEEQQEQGNNRKLQVYSELSKEVKRQGLKHSVDSLMIRLQPLITTESFYHIIKLRLGKFSRLGPLSWKELMACLNVDANSLFTKGEINALMMICFKYFTDVPISSLSSAPQDMKNTKSIVLSTNNTSPPISNHHTISEIVASISTAIDNDIKIPSRISVTEVMRCLQAYKLELLESISSENISKIHHNVTAGERLLQSTKDRNHIYCSGHGLLPNTPIKNVERVIEIIKN